MATQMVSGNPPGKIGLADAPAVELALSRSKLYLLLSWGFLFPEDEEFYNYLQEGEFVEDGLAAIETLEKEFGGSKLTELYREESERYLKDPPQNGFDGQIVLHEK